MTRLLRAALALCLFGGAACVDETGYEGADGGIAVDETGYLKPDVVFYSAPNALSQPQPVTVLGLAGALCPPGGDLVIEGPAGAAPDLTGPDADGAFRIDLEATAGDEIVFRYTPPGDEEGYDVLRLADALDDVPAPGPPGTSSGPGLLSPDASSGDVTVDPSALTSGDPPFVIFNQTANGAAVMSDAGESVTLPAATGDTVCLFSVRLTDGAQSPHVCGVVPAL